MFKEALVSLSTKVAKAVGPHAPKILLGASIAGTVGGTVLACRATLKSQEILRDASDRLQEMRAVKESYQDDPEEVKAVEKDIAKTYISTVGKVAKAYAPAVAVEGLAIFFGIKSYQTMNARLAKATSSLAVVSSAYTGLQKQFEAYRDRNREAIGVEAEKAMYYNAPLEKVTETVIGEDGKKHKVTTTKAVLDPEKVTDISPNARFFDETCAEYEWLRDGLGRPVTPDNALNLLKLKQMEDKINRENHRLGGISLRQAMQIIEPSWEFRDKDAYIMGWGPEEHISLGLEDSRSMATRRFVNGIEDVYLIDLRPTRCLYADI